MSLTTKERKRLFAPYLELFQTARRRRQLSQAQLAEAAGLSSKYVTMIESGKRLPSMECFVALLSVAGVSRKAAGQLMTSLLDQFEWTDE